MPRSKKGDSKVLPVIGSIEVRHVVGRVTDDTISAILKFEPSMEDLEVAASYLRGEGSEANRLGHQLTGKVARSYDILSADALYQRRAIGPVSRNARTLLEFAPRNLMPET